MKLRNKKTGEIGELEITKKHCAVEVGNGTASCGIEIYNSLAELNEEWKDYEEPKTYYYISDFGTVRGEDVGKFVDDEMLREEIGNYFETPEEAEKAVEKLKAAKRLKDMGFVFKGINMIDGSIKTGLSKGVSWNDCEGFYSDMELLFDGKEMQSELTLENLVQEWEDYEEPKRFYWLDYNGDIYNTEIGTMDRSEIKEIGNYFETVKEAELAVRKLKAWKRLKDKGFRFDGWDNTDRSTIHNFSLSVTIENLESINKDLDLLFGGEE